MDGVRVRLEASGAQIALIYGDVSRSADIHYLTNLCLYWNEAVLVIPLVGAPVLVTKLSKRVQPWMHRTSTLEDIRSGPRLTENICSVLDERSGGRAGRIALIDLPWWPNKLVTELRTALPQAQLQDLGPAVRDSRLQPSADEWSLLQRGAELLDAAMESAWQRGGDADERTSIAIRGIRRAGFEDAMVTFEKLSDGSEFADVVGQYRYVWLHQSRPRGGPSAEMANDTMQVALAAARPGMTEAQLVKLAAAQVTDRYEVELSCAPYPDIETRGLCRIAQDAQRPLKEGEVVCIALSLASEAGVIEAAETVKITPNGATALV
ncbi:MAG: aminopeptidase P family N-terminal domain-containing protein [Steroidobacteraceae bacterium]